MEIYKMKFEVKGLESKVDNLGLITEEDILDMTNQIIEVEKITEAHGLGTALKAAKAGSYAGSAAANM